MPTAVQRNSFENFDRRPIGELMVRLNAKVVNVQNAVLYSILRGGTTEEDAMAVAKKANAHDFIVGLPEVYDTMLAERGANLSQGQRQMIASPGHGRRPENDDPRGHVERDTRIEKLIQDGMRKLMDDKTSFSIAHRLATIRDSDRIMVLTGGEIEGLASHEDLMAAKGFYYALYVSQFKGEDPGGDPERTAIGFVST